MANLLVKECKIEEESVQRQTIYSAQEATNFGEIFPENQKLPQVFINTE